MNTRTWSGDTLMDIDKNQALKLKNQSIDGPEYLFLEFAGFRNRHKTTEKLSGVSFRGNAPILQQAMTQK